MEPQTTARFGANGADHMVHPAESKLEGRRLDLSPHLRRKLVVMSPRVASPLVPLLLLLCLLLLASTAYALILAGGSLGGASPPPSGSLCISFMDVGQGDGVLVQAGGEDYLIDAGRAEEGANVVDFLRGRGVYSLEAIVVTNPPNS
jgi:beta-lactamase superfamily II metal-dependent hydrolase